jgi:hypothetical protein
MDYDSCRLKASLQLFDKLECCSSSMNGDLKNVDAALVLVDIDKMRCHIINCLTAMHLVETEKKEKEAVVDNDDYELAKSKVFNAAISMISDDKFDSDEAIVKSILLNLPISDERTISDGRSWLPQHFAIALGVRNKISEDDIRIMLSMNPLAIHRLNKIEADNESEGCIPILEDPKISVLCDQSGRCALHLVAQYSESLELLQDILQIDHKMTKSTFDNEDTGDEIPPLGLLCRRRHFPTFDALVLCFIEVDSSVDVIYGAMVEHLKSYAKCLSQNISPGSRGAMSLILLRNLLDTNPAVIQYEEFCVIHLSCYYLRGELGVSVLSLFLTTGSTGVKAVRDDGVLPIDWAARKSCLDVLKLLHKAWPESISMLGTSGRSLLHRAITDSTSDIEDVEAKVQYMCDQCPALIHLKDSNGYTPLHGILSTDGRFNFGCVKILCNVDATVVRDKCTSPITDGYSGKLPLHTLIYTSTENISEVSVEGDCFRLLLRLYPAAAGIEDGHSRSPYDLAVSRSFSTYLIRLLLAADPTIDPVRRHDLNFAARRQGMFLAFSAFSSNLEPTIWAKLRLKGRDLLQHVISYL